MKNKIKRFTALLLALLFLAGAFPAAAGAASMPAGVSESDIQNAIPKSEALVAALLSLSEETSDLSGRVYEMLFSDETLNKLLITVYGALSDQVATFSTMGVDISVKGVAEAMYNYPEVQAALSRYSSWEAVQKGDFSPAWNVSSKEGFGHAAAAMFTPMNELLYALLCGGTYRPNVMVSVKGANGYENAIVPILAALGTPEILTQEVFAADAKSSRYSMVKNICAMLFSALDQFLAAPVQSGCRYLPAVADYLVNDGLTESLNSLVEPLKVRVGLISLTGVDKMLERLDVFSSSASLTEKLEDLDTTALFGSDVDLTLPKVDLEALSQCGSKENGVFTANEPQAFVLIFRWAVEAVKLNAAALPEMLGQDLSAAKNFIDKLLARDTDDILRMFLDLLSLKPADTVLRYQWTYPAYTPGTVEFTPNLGREDYVRVLDGIDSTLNDFMAEFTDNGTLSGTLAARIYSNSLLSRIVTSVFGALYTEQTAGLLKLLGLDASPKGVAAAVSGVSPAAARTLRQYDDWSKVNPSAISWGFTNGSRQGFMNALTALLEPMRPFLRLLLAEGDLTLLGTVKISGSNGYDTAVIPLLEALGCDDNVLKSYADYKRTAGTSAVVTDILSPIADLLDALIERPVATMCGILPNLVYFVNAGGLGQCAENLLYPVRVMLKTIGAEDLLKEELAGLTNVDLNKTVGDLIARAGLDIKLPAPDLNKLASLGTAETRVSKRTYNGTPASMTYITADAPAVLVTVLRYAVGALGSEENAAVLSGLMQQDQTQEGDMMAMYTGKVAEQLKTMSTDETIEWLYNLLFAETPKQQDTVDPDAPIPTIIYNEREKHTGRNVTAIVIGAVVFIVLAALVLSRIDFGAWKERRRSRKKRIKALKAQGRAKAAPTAANKTPSAPGRAAPAEQKRSVPAAPAATAPALKNGMTEKERIRHERELAKMRVREEKARLKAYRKTKKADKYYEQALREQQRKKH